MATSTHVVKGIPLPPGGGPLPTRKEISAWISQANTNALYARQVALFIKALNTLQKLDPDDELSYYRIAGIHGDPEVPWDGVQNPPNDPNQDPSAGWWCVHNKPNFVTWHRPYLALFEQHVYETMLQIISQSGLSSTDQGPWVAAAQQWRLPYWDWAIKQNYLNPPNYGIADIFNQQTVSILDFNGNQIEVKNPLWNFSNPRQVPMGDGSMASLGIRSDPWRSLIGTSRCGIMGPDPDPSWVNGANNWQTVNSLLETPEVGFGNDVAGPLGEAVYKLLSPGYFESWVDFETTLFTDFSNPNKFLSIEYLHNCIHTWTGGSSYSTGIGHMTDPSVSAFDPIFWFHHCNVDRIGAIFQTLNPDMWYQDVPTRGTHSLTPFHRDAKRSFWTSDECRNWRVLNYDYDDLSAPADPSADPSSAFGFSLAAIPTTLSAPGIAIPPATAATHTAERAAAPPAAATTHTAKGTTAPSTAKDPPAAGPAGGVNIAALKKTINTRYGQIRYALQNAPHIGGRDNDYIINIIYDRYALDGRPYTLHFFIGAPPSGQITTAALQSSTTYLGSVYTFSSSLEREGNTVACGNCRHQQRHNALSTGQIPITSALLKHAKDENIPELESLHPDAVENYLESKLNWIAIEALSLSEEENLDIPTEIPQTRIYVLRGAADHPDSENELSNFGNYTFLWRATQGKPGGADPNTPPPNPGAAAAE